MTDKKQDEKSFDSSKINTQELQKYKQDYSEHSFKEKLRKYAKIIGVGAVYKVLQLWYVLQKPDVPLKQKALITGAIGYLIAPLDFIPDLTPVLGYSDDLWLLLMLYCRFRDMWMQKLKKNLSILLKIFLGLMLSVN
jgi:uncharacterized membrane protein YkvA (DUF1232 family)